MNAALDCATQPSTESDHKHNYTQRKKDKPAGSENTASIIWKEHLGASIKNTQGWPEPYIYTVHDRIFGNFRAKITVYTLYICGSGLP